MPPSRLAYTPVHNDKPNQSPASDPTSSNSSYSESPAKAMVMVKKVKKGKRDRHRYKAQPLSPLPYLSNEIWGMILSYLKRPFPRIGSPVPVKKFHQNDLASCMRVNTQLNSIAASILYKRPIVKDLGSFAYLCDIQTSNSRLTKRDCLRLMDRLFIEQPRTDIEPPQEYKGIQPWSRVPPEMERPGETSYLRLNRMDGWALGILDRQR